MTHVTEFKTSTCQVSVQSMLICLAIQYFIQNWKAPLKYVICVKTKTNLLLVQNEYAMHRYWSVLDHSRLRFSFVDVEH